MTTIEQDNTLAESIFINNYPICIYDKICRPISMQIGNAENEVGLIIAGPKSNIMLTISDLRELDATYLTTNGEQKI